MAQYTVISIAQEHTQWFGHSNFSFIVLYIRSEIKLTANSLEGV
jgi:hypothetical protein